VEQSDEGAFVTVVRGEKRERVRVRTGLRSEREVEIEGGVKEGATCAAAAWRGAARRSLDWQGESPE
jgi:hypothetical protein